MLIPFALSTTSVESTAPDVAVAIARVEQLTQLWRGAGLLVIDRGGTHLSAIRSAISVQPEPIRKRWQEALIALSDAWLQVEGWSLPRRRSPTFGSSVQPAESVVVGLQERRRWGIPAHDPAAIIDSGVEIARFDSLSTTRLAARVSSMSHRQFEPRSPVDDIREHFKYAFQAARTITLVDQYLGKNLAANGPRDGVGRLTEWIALERGQIGRALDELAIFTAKGIPRSRIDPRPVDSADILAAAGQIAASIKPAHIVQIRLDLADTNPFGTEAHERHIRFDRAAYSFHGGFTLCAGRRLEKRLRSQILSPGDAERTELGIRSLPSHETHTLPCVGT